MQQKTIKILFFYFSLPFLLNCHNLQKDITKYQQENIILNNNFPDLEIYNLNTIKTDRLYRIFNKINCPCNTCPKSLGKCLQEDNTCYLASIIAQSAIDQMKNGFKSSFVEQRLYDEITNGFLKESQQINIKNYSTQGITNQNTIINIVEFADFECGYCQFILNDIKNFIKKHKKEITFTFKHFPLKQHIMSQKAAIAAEAAAEQDKFWEMHDCLFDAQILNSNFILSCAKKIDLNVNKFFDSLKDQKITNKVNNSFKEALILKLKGTPSIFINGRPMALPYDEQSFEIRLKMEKIRKTSKCCHKTIDS